MSIPDYIICLECESPLYTFEWKKDKIAEAMCEICGNEDTTQFATEGEYEDLALDRRYTTDPKTIG